MPTEIITLLGSLGSAAAAVAVTWFFLNALKILQANVNALASRLFDQLAQLSHEKSRVIEENTRAIAEIRVALEKLTQAVEKKL